MDNNELLARIEELEADGVVLRGYVTALISLLPNNTRATDILLSAMQSINGAGKGQSDHLREVLARAHKRLNGVAIPRVG